MREQIPVATVPPMPDPKTPSTADLMSGDLQPGPFDDTTTRTYKISPIEISITSVRKSTHVPAPEPECGCSGGGISPEFIMQAVESIKNATSTPPNETD